MEMSGAVTCCEHKTRGDRKYSKWRRYFITSPGTSTDDAACLQIIRFDNDFVIKPKYYQFSCHFAFTHILSSEIHNQPTILKCIEQNIIRKMSSC